MNYHDAMTNISTKPEELVFDLSEGFRHHGATILARKKIDSIPNENADAQKCWEAQYEISQKEFDAYRANNYFMYQSIDREQPFVSRKIDKNCTLFTNTSAPGADSWFLLVELPPRSAQCVVYRPTLDTFFLFGRNAAVQGLATSYTQEQVGISICTRLYIWAWRLPDGQDTYVYLQARPVSGQIEAKPGNSIGWNWWQLANGYDEQQTVRNYIALIQEYDHKKRTE